MKRYLGMLSLMFVLVSLCLLPGGTIPVAPVSATLPNVTLPMLSADYWVTKLADPDRVIMQPEAIQTFNREIIAGQPDLIHDLAAYPASLAREQLVSLISGISGTFPPSLRYAGGKPATAAYRDSLKRLVSLGGIGDVNQVRYGFAVRRASLRSFPTADLAGNVPNFPEYDLFQETAIQPAEPLLVLHPSLDGRWSFVQTYNCRGWVNTGDLAICRNKKEWQDYQSPENFLAVTGSHIRLSANPYSTELSELEFGMGCRLPLADPQSVPAVIDGQGPAGSYVVTLPVRDPSGQASFKLALVPVSSDVSVGYLPYTRANIIRQVFKTEGERYGWGGMLNGRDCSALVVDVFGSFGFRLPRNSEEQAADAGKTVQFQGRPADRATLLRNLSPGIALHFPGHVMFYLGEDHDRYYVISALGFYIVFQDSTRPRVAQVQSVVVNDLGLRLRGGQQWLDYLTVGKLYE